MRKIIFSFWLCCMLMGIALRGICQNNTFETVKYFIEIGDMKNISNRLDDVVLVDILGKSNYYSKRQAAKIVTSFFKEHPIEKFTILSTGGNRSSSFGIARMRTHDMTYRITCSVSAEKNNDFSIHRIKIEIDD